MAGFEAIARKISRPPGAQNCARLNVISDEQQTTALIAQFALSIPPFNYIPAIKQCRTHVQFGLDVETATNAVLLRGAPAGRDKNASLVRAFYDYDEERGYSKCLYVDGYDGEYRLSRDVHVPTRATFTILENGNLVPVTICGWKSLSLDVNQIRFWMTMMEIGLYSHSDYRRSPAEVALFLEEQTSEGPARFPHIIRRGDYTLFSPAEMRDQAELYIRAQAAALPIAEAKWTERERRRNQEEPETGRVDPREHPHQPGLFD
jgi:hypothetical protein